MRYLFTSADKSQEQHEQKQAKHRQEAQMQEKRKHKAHEIVANAAKLARGQQNFFWVFILHTIICNLAPDAFPSVIIELIRVADSNLSIGVIIPTYTQELHLGWSAGYGFLLWEW